MGTDVEARRTAVVEARERMQELMRRHSDDPRSNQLIDEARHQADAELRRLRAELADAEARTP